ncbi:uncharacterized protein LOC122301671 [Carya illinoinensis]|uniref:uncharacterized protein LOC122301671 n=1 Tax=Carya illinoinensis TaxID=32201 RepID=UPI001C728AA0|nr:uncharacterized protein LOC122301671 [Carya illinoinensis]
MELFREVFQEGNLYDLGWQGDKYTWGNLDGDETFTKERLDRAVSNPVWIEVYKEVWVEMMVASTSDHKPLLVHLKEYKVLEGGIRKAFKYEANWALDEEFELILKKAWKHEVFERHRSSKMVELLNRSKEVLQKWSKQLRKGRKNEIEERTNLLQRLQAVEDRYNVIEIKRVKEEVSLMLEKDDLRWRQRAKTNWYKLGDRNTKYFHACTNQRKKRNQIIEVENESNIRVRGFKEIEDTFRGYFVKLFQTTNPTRVSQGILLDWRWKRL